MFDGWQKINRVSFKINTQNTGWTQHGSLEMHHGAKPTQPAAALFCCSKLLQFLSDMKHLVF